MHKTRFSKMLCRLLVRCTAAILLVVTISPSGSDAQDTRQNPAPWRPAFGSVNRDAQSDAEYAASIANPNNAAGSGTSQTQPGTAGGSGSQTHDAQGWPLPAQPNFGAGLQTQWQPRNTLPHLGQNNLSQYQRQNPGEPAARMAKLSGDTNITRVTRSRTSLPNTAGQVWREYDISPYTARVTSSEKPQQAIVDWILRETGTKMWFNEPLGFMNANKNQLLVYHTPEVQSEVKKIVDRFVHTQGQLQNLDVNLVTVKNPNWRSTAYRMLQPIEVQTPGVEAWLISKENAALLMNQLSRRSDFKQHSSGRATAHDGQPFELNKRNPVQFVRSIRWLPNQSPGYQPVISTVNEGYSLSMSGLSMLDGRSIETTIKCDVDQVEKLTSVKVDVPGLAGTNQKMNLQIPQVVSWRLHERFRWPNDQVLLLSCGIVADPDPNGAPANPLGGLGNRLGGGLLGNPSARRADALLLIDYRGPVNGAGRPPVRMPTAPGQRTRTANESGSGNQDSSSGATAPSNQTGQPQTPTVNQSPTRIDSIINRTSPTDSATEAATKPANDAAKSNETVQNKS